MKSSILFCILLFACVTEVIFASSDLQDAKNKVQMKKAAVRTALNDVRGNKLSLQLKTVSQLAMLKYNTTQNLMNLVIPERYDAKAKLDVASPTEKNHTTICYTAVNSVLNDSEIYVANHAEKLEKRANEVIRDMMKVFDENEVIFIGQRTSFYSPEFNETSHIDFNTGFTDVTFVIVKYIKQAVRKRGDQTSKKKISQIICVL